MTLYASGRLAVEVAIEVVGHLPAYLAAALVMSLHRVKRACHAYASHSLTGPGFGRIRESSRALVGHSLGGAAVLAAAAELPAVSAVALIGAPFDAGHVRTLLAEDAETIERAGEAVVSIAGRAFRIRREFLDDLHHAKSRAAIAGLGRPLMIMHSPADTIVRLDEARRIFEVARHPKSFVALDDADHLLSRRADAIRAAGILSAWATKYL